MPEQTVLVSIDVGTTKVCVLIGEVSRAGGLDVIGFGQAPSDGLRKGVVIDIDRTVHSVTSAVEAAERLSGFKVRSAFVGRSRPRGRSRSRTPARSCTSSRAATSSTARRASATRSA